MISIVIPTYNEKDNIKKLVSEIENALGKLNYEVIFVDDNSPDGTADSIRKLDKKNIRVIERAGKLGLASAVVAGVQKSKGDIIVVMDADISHPPEVIPKMIENICGGCDIAVGSRFVSGGGVVGWPAHRKMISLGATNIAKFMLGVKCNDPMSGFFAVKRSCFERLNFRIRGYKILLNILVDNRKATISEVPYTFENRTKGKSKMSLNEIFLFLRDVTELAVTNC